MKTASVINEFNQSKAEDLLILTFSCETSAGRINCGLNIHKVREVIEVSKMALLPKEYDPFMGIHDLRGIPIPVIPLCHILQKEESTKDLSIKKNLRIIIIEIQNQVLGLIICHIGQIKSFRNAVVQSPPKVFEKIKARFFNGVLKENEQYIYLVDIEMILDSYGLSFDKEIDQNLDKDILKGKRVLVVEDSRLYQKKIQKLFSEWGCQLEFAFNGQEALAILQKKKDSFDLIFCDIEMPVMNGIEFVSKIKKDPQLCHLPVVFNSSLSNPMLIEEIKDLGDYIVKFDPHEIQDKIVKILNQNNTGKGQ